MPRRAAALLLSLLLASPAAVADPAATVTSTNIPAAAAAAQARLRVASGLAVELWAAEPLVQDVTSLAFDEHGRAYVVESGRRRTSVFDIRNLQPWLDADFALRSVADRAAFLREKLTPGAPDYDAFLAAVAKSKFGDFNRDGVTNWHDLEVEQERVRLVWDADGDGRADTARTFAEGFSSIVSGVAAGVLARGTNVWFTSIPDLWRFPAAPPAGEERRRGKGEEEQIPFSPLHPGPSALLLTGFGVHVAFGGHDLHGLIFGPDGRLYFSIADRGLCVTNREGVVLNVPDTGAVLRCEPDGAHLEVFATGLRNPQELAFDDFGNLWTGDNNGDGGDKARWTLVLEGADYGWSIGWQWLPKMGAWNSERLWHTRESNSAAYVVPPVAHVGHGPAGIAHYPGTGLGDRFTNHFFYSDFPGGIRTFRVEPDGAFFRVGQVSNLSTHPAPGALGGVSSSPAGRTAGRSETDGGPVANRSHAGVGQVFNLSSDISSGTSASPTQDGRPAANRSHAFAWLEDNSATNLAGKLLWNLAPVDVAFPPGGGVVVADAFPSWEKTGTARLWRVSDPALKDDPAIAEVARLLREGMAKRDDAELARLLGHRDQRVRLEAQFELAGRGTKGWPVLERVALQGTNTLARLHAIWGLGQIVRRAPMSELARELDRLLVLLEDPDAEVRGWAARLHGEARYAPASWTMIALLQDPSLRVRAQAFLGYRDFGTGGGRFKPGVWRGLLRKLPFAVRLRLSPLGQDDGVLLPVTAPAFILEAWQTGDPVLRFATVAALRSQGVDPSLLGAPEPEVRVAAAYALRTTGQDRLAGLLGDSDSQVVLEAARAVHDIGIDNGFPRLAALLGAPALAALQHRENLPFTLDEARAWILRRAVNANFRLGWPQHAAALGDFAARTAVDPQASALAQGVAVEALECLAVWTSPPGRDRVTGLWRPLEPRSAQPAMVALEKAWRSLTATNTPAVILVAALRSAEALRLHGLDSTLARLAGHADPAVADEVKRLLGRRAEEPAALAARLESGGLRDQQAALAALAASTNAAADGIVLAWLDRLLSNAVPAGLQLDVFEAAQQRAAGILPAPRPVAGEIAGKMPAALSSVGPGSNRSTDPLQDGQRTGFKPVPPFAAALSAFTNSLVAEPAGLWRLSLAGGDPAAGRKLFAERADWGCQRCHKLHGEGGDVGPDLTGLTKTRGAEYVLAAILHPNQDIAPGYENVVITRKSGGALVGVLKSETDTEVILDVPEDGRVTIPKSDLADRQRGLSAMVEGLGELITLREMRDLIAAMAE